MDEIRTDRLLWRLPRDEDFVALHTLVSDYEVVKWTGAWPHPANPDFTRSRCKPLDPETSLSGPIFLNGELIGTMGIANGELGYMFARKHWRLGYATEIGCALISRAFHQKDWGCLTARTGQENGGSARVLEKLGFQRVGAGHCGSVAQGSDIASFDYELTRQDWLLANPLSIKTERLQISAFTDEMAAEFQAIAAPAKVARMMLSLPHPINVRQSKDWMEKRQYTGKAGFSAAVMLPDGRLAGAVGIGGDPISIMYFLGVEHWGKGYASEMMTGFLRFCFDTFKLPRISAQALNTNIASQRVLEKLGFEYVRDIVSQSVSNLEPETDCEYRLTREQFEARP